jgi:hypothetical protein
MEKSYSYIQKKTMDQMSINGTSIKYGKESNIDEYWRQIANCNDQSSRYEMIDQLLMIMENNAAQNGFWRADDEIRITFGIGSNAVHLDDKNIYYNFFDNLNYMYNKNNEFDVPLKDGAIALRSVFGTIENYFGAYNGDINLRHQLTDMNFDTFEYPSISVLKGKGCGACVEKAAVAHNLWLLMGRESYYVSSTSSKFENSNDEGHAFCIIKNSQDRYMLYDHAMNNFGPLSGEPIQTLLNGEPLVIKEPFKNQGVYANALNLEKTNISTQ